MKTSMYLIKLYGVKTTYSKIVSEEVWQWVKGQTPTKKSRQLEASLELILSKEFKNAQQRAIAAPGKTFTDGFKLRNYLKDNSIEIMDEYRCMDS